MNSDSFLANTMAITAITKKGVALGRRLNQLVPDSHLYLPEKFADEELSGEFRFVPPAKKVIRQVFSQYPYLILIMAVGAVVRLLASELRSKCEDPAVVVVDEAGTFVVSLISGHGGGANELAKKVAHLIGAQPVVTTASEVSATIAVDLLGKEFGWELETSDNLNKVTASVVNDECTGIYQDTGERNWWKRDSPLPSNVHVFSSIEDLIKSNCKAAIIISDQVLSKENQLPPNGALVYRPRSMVVGIGCNRGTKAHEIEQAVLSLFSEYRLSIKSIRNLATIDLKKSETGILEFARKYNLPIEYYNKETLSKVGFPSDPSLAALEHVGTPTVCEAAAILSSGIPNLVIPKTSYARTVSIAVARLSFDTLRSPKSGKLFLVGLGPGAMEHMTFRAKEALSASDVVVGYKSYAKLVEPLITHKEVITTGMTEEVRRATIAVNLAQKGKAVSLICSGDSGIYGMAGLVGEISQRRGDKLDAEVVPGVPALVASAALLGAPLTGDFACISLSDHLVPWEEISQRLELAAQANFVIIIYNPRSKKRQRQLAKAKGIILQYREPTTPVGVVNNACREGQKVIITDMQHLLDHEIDMNTTIIVGNSDTLTFDKWMITPRGYSKKYDLITEALK